MLEADKRRNSQACAPPPRAVRSNGATVEHHYLEQELNELLKTDSSIFRFLQEGSLDGIWYWDLEAPEHEWMSPKFWQVFGFDPVKKKHLASEWQHLINPDDLEVALKNFRAHCADPNHPYDQVVRYTHKDGSTVWVRCRGIAVRNGAGKPIRMLGAHTDITELKRAEEELTAALASNRELEQFAYLASHDLREPLRVVVNYLELLELESANQLNEAQLHYIRVTTNAAARMQSLISGLLDYARIGTRQRPLVPVHTREVVGRVQSLFGPRLQMSGAELTLGTLPRVLGDPDQLHQVFSNLLDNGIKFAGSNVPQISIYASRSDQSMWTFCVADQGIGIEAGSHERIFQIFQRLHRADTADGQGAGVGLALCRHIVQSHGGQIWVESQPGQGSQFFFTLRAVDG